MKTKLHNWPGHMNKGVAEVKLCGMVKPSKEGKHEVHLYSIKYRKVSYKVLNTVDNFLI